jgi:protein TonB
MKTEVRTGPLWCASAFVALVAHMGVGVWIAADRKQVQPLASLEPLTFELEAAPAQRAEEAQPETPEETPTPPNESPPDAPPEIVPPEIEPPPKEMQPPQEQEPPQPIEPLKEPDAPNPEPPKPESPAPPRPDDLAIPAPPPPPQKPPPAPKPPVEPRKKPPEPKQRPAPRPQEAAPAKPTRAAAPQVDRVAAAAWQSQVMAHIERRKTYPSGARARGEEGVAVVRFRIGGNGAVGGVALVRSSGSAELDRETLALVTRASPLPPHPSGAAMTVTAPVRYRLR